MASFGTGMPPMAATTDASTTAGRTWFSDSGHPWAAFFHLAFRTAAVLVYLFCTLFTDNFVLVFVITVVLLSFDFWTVKNVSGRLLVGLRWWTEVKEDGTNVWIFESRQVRRTRTDRAAISLGARARRGARGALTHARLWCGRVGGACRTTRSPTRSIRACSGTRCT